MNADHVFAGLIVSDLARAKDWYVVLLGREPDLVPHDREVMWQVTANANLYVLEDPERAGNGTCAIAVSDLDAEVARITAGGLELGGLETVTPGARKVTAVDPDGNTIQLLGLS